MRVSIIWRLSTMFVLGLALGMFLTIKFMVPPSTSISIGKVKIRGKGNTVSDMFDISQDTQTANPRSRRSARLENRRADDPAEALTPSRDSLILSPPLMDYKEPLKDARRNVRINNRGIRKGKRDERRKIHRRPRDGVITSEVNPSLFLCL